MKKFIPFFIFFRIGYEDVYILEQVELPRWFKEFIIFVSEYEVDLNSFKDYDYIDFDENIPSKRNLVNLNSVHYGKQQKKLVVPLKKILG